MNTVEKFREFWDSLGYTEHKELWRLMSALRGPDDGNLQVKYETTARIRRALFEKRLYDSNIFVDVSEFGPSYTREEMMNKTEEHFRLHYEAAANVLAEQVPGFKAYKEDSLP